MLRLRQILIIIMTNLIQEIGNITEKEANLTKNVKIGRNKISKNSFASGTLLNIINGAEFN